jgi:TolA-binding protein
VTPRPILPIEPRASAGVAPSPGPSAVPVDPDSLYRFAHRAQFEARDYSVAAEAWDRYLAAAPNGTFAPEARWSRAIALVRLGRNTEAANALEPFARGDYGPYRRDEARSLLATLKK